MSKELLNTRQNWTDVAAIREGVVLQPEFVIEPESGSMLDYWRAAPGTRSWWQLCSTAGLLLGLGVALLQPAVYRANSSLEIQDVKNDAGKILTPTPGHSGGGSAS